MTKRFRESTLDQMYLLPPSLQDWLPDGHLARFVAELCEELKLDRFLAKHEERDGRGQAAYHPVLLVRLLVYGYCVGKRSSRQIEKATHDDVGFRYLSANQHPDHTTIAEFRRQHIAELSELFAQVLVLCRKAGLVKLGAIAVDGTKMLANASPEETARYMQLCQWEQRLEEKIKAMLEEAERVDREEDAAEKRDGIQRDLPEEMATTKQRLEKIRQVKQELEEETREKADKVRAERQASGGKHRNEAAKKRHQRATKPIEKINPQGNLVDPDSKLLKDPVTGGFIQAFNAQVAVDAQTQIIVAAAVTNELNDREQLQPMAKLIEQSIEGKPEVLLADAGYFANEPMEELEKNGWKLTVNPDAARKRSQAPANAAKSEIAARMRKRIRDEVEGPIYQLRKQTVEPVFGQIKEARGIRRFLLRGFEKVRAEWQLICLTHNALKLYRNAPAMFERAAKAA